MTLAAAAPWNLPGPDAYGAGARRPICSRLQRFPTLRREWCLRHSCVPPVSLSLRNGMRAPTMETQEGNAPELKKIYPTRRRGGINYRNPSNYNSSDRRDRRAAEAVGQRGSRGRRAECDGAPSGSAAAARVQFPAGLQSLADVAAGAARRPGDACLPY